MKICNFCGTENADTSNICSSCGGNEFKHKCGNCGYLIDEGNFCPICGVKVGSSAKKSPNCCEDYLDRKVRIGGIIASCLIYLLIVSVVLFVSIRYLNIDNTSSGKNDAPVSAIPETLDSEDYVQTETVVENTEEMRFPEQSENSEEEESPETIENDTDVQEYNFEKTVIYNGKYGELKLTELKDNALVFEFDNPGDNEYNFYDISVSANKEIYIDADFSGELRLAADIVAGAKTKFYFYFPLNKVDNLTTLSANILVCDADGYHLDVLATDELNLYTGDVIPASEICDEASTYGSSMITEKKLIAETRFGDMYLCGMTDSAFILQFDNKTNSKYSLYGDSISINGTLYIDDDFRGEKYAPFGVIGRTLGLGSSKVLFYYPNLKDEKLENISFTFLFCMFAEGYHLEQIATEEITLN